MARTTTDNTVLDAQTQTLRCTVCGDQVPIPLGSVEWVTGVFRAFGEAHRGGPHAGHRTWMSEPRPEQGTALPGARMTPGEWIVRGEIGISSRTIWSVLHGGLDRRAVETCGPSREYDIPYDPDDLRRCRLLLEAIPEWRRRLPEVATVFTCWRPLVEHWAELEALMDEEAPRWREREGSALRTYALMQRLISEGRQLVAAERGQEGVS